MRVSVITSTFNRDKRLKKAIESVLRQSFKEFEYVIVDDGSTDSTQEVVKSFNDPRIRYIRRPKNFGKDTRPKNEGILASKGEYISFLDDDNTFRPDHLQVLVNELDNNPEIALVYGNRWVTDEDKQRPPMMGFTSDFKPTYLLQRNYIDTSEVMVRRESLFEVGGFDESLSKYIDRNLWVRLEKCGFNFKHVPIIITDYTLHSGSKSKKVFTKAEQELLNASGESRNIPEWDPLNCEIALPYLGEVKEPRVAIFTITYDRLDYTERTNEALQATAGYPYFHLFVDNGSTDGTAKGLKELQQLKPDTKAILNSKNLGISKASNQAIDFLTTEGFDIIMKVDNDCLFQNKGWLATMVKIWKVNRRLALSCYVEGLKDSPGGAPREAYGMIAGELLGMTKHLGGICHFVDAKAYKKFRWDEHSFLHGMQDVEFSQYLQFNGYQCAYLENWFCEHMDRTEGQLAKYPEYFERRKQEKTTRNEENR